MFDWLQSNEARCVVRRTARRYRLSGYDADEDTVLAEAAYAVWRRMQSPTPLSVGRPASYGTAVIRSILVRVVDLRDRSAAELPLLLGERAEPVRGDDDPAAALRAQFIQATGHEWLQRAALAYIDLAIGDLVLTDDVPQPRSGATPAQARAWAALWIAGLEHLFPQPDTPASRTARSRKVRALLSHLGGLSGRGA